MKLFVLRITLTFCSIFAVCAILSIISGSNNFNIETAFAQNSTDATNASNGSSIDSFRAQGQISSLASDTLAGRTQSNSSEMWILGGLWEFNVVDGNLTNFVIDIDMTKIDGTASHKHTIEKLNNASGMPMGGSMPVASGLMTEQPSTKIALEGNSTMFRGMADVTTNDNVQWRDVPAHLTIVNGNIAVLNTDPTKTEDHFKGLPVLGLLTLMVDENGKEIVKK